MSCFSKQQPRGLLAQEKAVTGLAFPGLHKALQICEPAGLSSTLLGFVLSLEHAGYSYFPPHPYRELKGWEFSVSLRQLDCNILAGATRLPTLRHYWKSHLVLISLMGRSKPAQSAAVLSWPP